MCKFLRAVNHSEHNNLKVIQHGDELFFHSKIKINKGDEITANYAEFMKEFNFKKNLLAFQENKQEHQAIYDEMRKYMPEMYRRPIGTLYFFKITPTL